MRKRKRNTRISVHAIAGTEVVLLGLDATPEAAKGLLGFSIYKRKGKTGKFSPLMSGRRTFLGEQDEQPDDTTKDARRTPIQAFMWSDYVVDRGDSYTYKVVPVYGSASKLVPDNKNSLEVTIRTEDPQKHAHGVFFNRGVAGSRAYAKRFGKYRKWYLDERLSEFLGKPSARPFVKPKDVPNREAHKWLSRGLEEAMLDFVAQAKKGDKLRASVYEFSYAPIIQAFVSALERGVDVKIIYHSKTKPLIRLKNGPRQKKGEPARAKPKTVTEWSDGLRPDDEVKATASKPLKRYPVEERIKANEAKLAERAVSQIGLNAPKAGKLLDELLKSLNKMLIPRVHTSAISHNKFIVLLEKGKPTKVWTGSTNFTEGGVFGQSNVGHVIRDKKIARTYNAYWNQLSKDPVKPRGKPSEIQKWTVDKQPDLKGLPPTGTTVVFSPRSGGGMLDWYADLMDSAKQSLFFTAAFSVANEIFAVVSKEKELEKGDPYLRYLMLEGTGGHLKEKFPVMQACPQNRMAWGDKFKKRRDQMDDEPIETLTGLNSHVNYLHTKFMLIDPLSNDPIVVSGSANFSEASTTSNDENMLIIRGNSRVADIFLTEYMRLFNHFHTRNRSNKLSAKKLEAARKLQPSDKWTKSYYDPKKQEYHERLLFA